MPSLQVTAGAVHPAPRWPGSPWPEASEQGVRCPSTPGQGLPEDSPRCLGLESRRRRGPTPQRQVLQELSSMAAPGTSDMTSPLLSGKDGDSEGPLYQVRAVTSGPAWQGRQGPVSALQAHTSRATAFQDTSVTFRVVGASGVWHDSALQTSGGQEASSSGDQFRSTDRSPG